MHYSSWNSIIIVKYLKLLMLKINLMIFIAGFGVAIPILAFWIKVVANGTV